MEFYHKQIVKLALWVTGDKELYQFTLHKAALQFLGYDWWDEPGWTVGRVFKRIIHPLYYLTVFTLVTILTGHKCFKLDTTTSLGFLVFMNNIIIIFTFTCCIIKSIYMKLFYGNETKVLLKMLVDIGDMKQGRPSWEASLKAFTGFLGFLLNLALLWSVYCLSKYHLVPYQTSYPWDQTTAPGRTAAFQISFWTATYASLIHASIDSLISVSCGIILAHLTVLIDILRGIGRPGNRDETTLIEAVQLHVKLIRSAGQMNYCFNVLFAFQSVYTVLHACVIIFAFIKTDDLIAAFSNTMPMLLASYLQMYLYCYYSQKLTSKFDELTFAVYDNYWYRSSLKVQQGLVMLTMVSKRQIALRGLGSAKASFASLLSSIQESVSYFLILKTVIAGESKPKGG